MSAEITDRYARPLECMELTERHEAEPRISQLANTDDPDALDELCLRGRQLVREQPIGSTAALSGELIRDLAVCLGEIIMRYIRAEWMIDVQPVGDNENANIAWILVFRVTDGRRSLPVEAYVTRRFFGDIDVSFAEFLDSVIVMAKQVPGVYLGGYEHEHGGNA